MLSSRRFAFPGGHRLKRREEFARVLQGKPLVDKWFVVYARTNELGGPRLGIIAARRTISGAVGRNFAKRLVRELFRTTISGSMAMDIVVRARRELDATMAAEARSALNILFKALGSS